MCCFGWMGGSFDGVGMAWGFCRVFFLVFGGCLVSVSCGFVGFLFAVGVRGFCGLFVVLLVFCCLVRGALFLGFCWWFLAY